MMSKIFGFKKQFNLGIILGNPHEGFLSLDEYVNHYLMPFSPRFRVIEFAVASLQSAGIEDIIVIADTDKEFVQSYLIQEWPMLRFYVFDKADILETFNEFFKEYLGKHKVDRIAIVQGDFPVWFDFNQLKEKIQKGNMIALKARSGDKEFHPAVLMDRPVFMKKWKQILQEIHGSTENFSLNVEKLLENSSSPVLEVPGYFMPIESIEHYYLHHINMLDSYHLYDRFNSYVPIRGEMGKSVDGIIQTNSHFINSIIGEGAEVDGHIENSIIFTGVRVAKGAIVKNSVILPGNYIGPKAVVINTIIDEFSGDNTMPNIEKQSQIGAEKASAVNSEFPDVLNFGVTMIGKDVVVPARTKIGANCYVESFTSTREIKRRKELADGESIVSDK